MLDILKKNYIRNGLIIVGLLLFLWILKTWFSDKIITLLGGYVNKEVEIQIDTQYVKGKIDTLEVFNAYVETKGIILNPIPKIEYRYKYIDPVNNKQETVDSIKSFNVKINDSLIDGTFHLINNFEGDLVYSKFNYKPKFPKYITSTDTIKTIVTKTITLDNKRALLGAGVGYTTINNLHIPSLSGSYTTKNNTQFIIEYGKPLNDIKQSIDNKNFVIQSSDLISFKIIKHF